MNRLSFGMKSNHAIYIIWATNCNWQKKKKKKEKKTKAKAENIEIQKGEGKSEQELIVSIMPTFCYSFNPVGGHWLTRNRGGGGCCRALRRWMGGWVRSIIGYLSFTIIKGDKLCNEERKSVKFLPATDIES